MSISYTIFEQLYKNGYTLDMVFLLKLIEQGVEVGELCLDSPKLEALYQSVMRKGLVSEKGNVTLSGKEVIKYLDIKEDVKFVKKAKTSSNFDLWWEAYPSTDTFSYKGKMFSGTRSLKAKKDDCKVKLNKIIDEGEYTIDELVKALKFEVDQKKENSHKTGLNKLSYMQNSLTYLNQKTYESFIDLIREGIVVENKPDYDGVNL